MSVKCRFCFNRELEEGVVEMICTLNIDANMLNSIWGYKYVVYSPKMVRGDDCFEYLHSFAGWSPYSDPNRCLKINRAELDSRFCIASAGLKHFFIII